MKADSIRGSLAGNILRVNLTTKEISIETTEKYARRFIGGRMINSFLLLNETKLQTTWSDPDNMLIFGVGALVGTLTPGACRVSVETKNPFNNGKGSANFGGHFGPELKYAGFDHVVITGKSDKPVFLWIHDGRAEIRDGNLVWGKTTSETETLLRGELGDQRIQVASIGPAGEHMVRGSIVYTNPGKVAGGSGVGCVMGDKKLKAIAVRGHGTVSLAEPESFIVAVNRALAKVKASPYRDGWRKGIIEAKYLPESPVWEYIVSARNGQDEYWPPEKRKRLVSKETGIPRYKKKMFSCHACPAGCMPLYEIDAGPYKGTKTLGYWINSAIYSTKLDLDDPEVSLRFHAMCNELGLDGDMCSTALGWAFECFEKGLLTKAETEGLELRWGDGEVALTLQEKLAYREGIGDLLADGVRNASQRLGKGSEAFAIHMKGQDSVDPYRILKGWGLGLSVSPVAGRHLRGAVSTPEVTGPRDVEWSPTEYENIPEVVFWQSMAKEIEDALGICIYLGTWSGVHALELPDYAELISSAMGRNLTEDDLMIMARRGINIEKAFNTLHASFDRKDDYPPRRYMEEPVMSGPYAGARCDRDQWDEMLDRYYELNGWDIRTGLQAHRCLKELGLEDIADMLHKAGKLVEE